MSEMNVCVAAVVDRNYQKYIPMFVYFCRVSYPSYGIRIFLTDPLHPTYREICTDLAREGDTKYIENMFRGYPKSNQESKSLRWLVSPAHFQGFDYIYMGDIDILICKEDAPLHLQHIKHSNEYNIPYSNSVRPNSERLTGLHFIITERYFQSTLPVIRKYAALLKGRKLRAVKDENLLYNIIRESGLALPSGWFRPHHGIHLGIWRKKEARISEEKWRTMGRDDYVKYYEYFLSVIDNVQYKKVYDVAPLKEISRMQTHLSAEFGSRTIHKMTPEEKRKFKKPFDEGRMKLDDSWNRYHSPKHPAYRKLRKRYGWMAQTITGPRVLDVGCGPGVGVSLFAERADVDAVAGLDICPITIKNATANIKTLNEEVKKKIRLHEGFAEELPFEGFSFDCVCMGETLEHVFSDKKAVAEAHRVLAPGGLFVCTVPLGGRTSQIHLRVFSVSRLTHLLRDYFNILNKLTFDGWICCTCKKK